MRGQLGYQGKVEKAEVENKLGLINKLGKPRSESTKRVISGDLYTTGTLGLVGNDADTLLVELLIGETVTKQGSQSVPVKDSPLLCVMCDGTASGTLSLHACS